MQDDHAPHSWYCIKLSQEQAEFGFEEIIRAEMAEIWLSRGMPEGVSVWLAREEATTLYFSPLAAEAATGLIFRFGGFPCAEPPPGKLRFLLGYSYPADQL